MPPCRRDFPQRGASRDQGWERNMKRALAVLSIAANLTGCASLTTGLNQTVSVQAHAGNEPVTGASCKLFNAKGTWFVTTPGSVSVHRSHDALHVACTKEGYAPAESTAAAGAQGMILGNIIFGGFIGAGVDLASGAAFDYPDQISFEMVRTMPTGATAGIAAAAVEPIAHLKTGKSGECATYSATTGRFTCK